MANYIFTISCVFLWLSCFLKTHRQLTFSSVFLSFIYLNSNNISAMVFYIWNQHQTLWKPLTNFYWKHAIVFRIQLFVVTFLGLMVGTSEYKFPIQNVDRFERHLVDCMFNQSNGRRSYSKLMQSRWFFGTKTSLYNSVGKFINFILRKSSSD